MLAILQSLTLPVEESEGRLYISPAGSGTACSPEEPCTLASAMSAAASGDTLFLAAGTYTGTGTEVLGAHMPLEIYGGWDGTPALVVDPQTYVSVLDGENARRVVRLGGAVTILLDGLTITGGATTEDGAGLYSQGVALTMRNLIFDGNAVERDSGDAMGGGAMIDKGSLVLVDSTFRLNSAKSPTQPAGGGLAVKEPTSARVDNCTFDSNDAWHGGAFAFLGPTSGPLPTLAVENCVFSKNGKGLSPGTATAGYAPALRVESANATIEANSFIENTAAIDLGAVEVVYGELALVRNRFLDNTSGRISALHLNQVHPLLVANNLFAGNQSTEAGQPHACVRLFFEPDGDLVNNTLASNLGEYGIRLQDTTVNLRNNILVDHKIGLHVDADSTAVLDSTLWGTGAWANDTDIAGPGSITSTRDIHGEPAFADPAARDFHLLPASAARNTGSKSTATTDLDGGCRPKEYRVDIGAYEYGKGPCLAAPLSVVLQILLDP